MSKRVIIGAALAAWSSFGVVAAQSSEPVNVAASIATAKLAEARGEFVSAQATLQAALERAKPAERQRVEAELQRLRRALGQEPVADVQGQQPGDPVARQIAILEQGTTQNERVGAAYRELDLLGPLVDEQLIAALPKAGMFGLRNLLNLLEDSEHPDLPRALGQLLDGDDPAVAAVLADKIAGLNREFRSEAVKVLALRLSGEAYPARMRARMLDAMLRTDVEHERILAVTSQLVEQPAARSAVAEFAIERRQTELTRAILHQLIAVDDEAGQKARAALLTSAADLDEATALQRLEAIEPDLRSRTARVLAEEHPDWVRVAALGISESMGSTEWLAAVEWWREPEVAMRALLRVPIDRDEGQAWNEIVTLIHNGWTAPAEFDEALVRWCERRNRGMDPFVHSLPADGEARAIAVLDTLSPTDRRKVFRISVELHRQWIELPLRTLEEQDEPWQNLQYALQLDWASATDEQIKRLVAIVQTCVDKTGAQGSGPQGTATTQMAWSNSNMWVDQLIQLVSSDRSLPSELLEPLALGGNYRAWGVLASLDPQRALELARSWSPGRIAENANGVVGLISKHGEATDVEMLLHALQQLARNGVRQDEAAASQAFLLGHAAGDPRVVALGVMNADWRLPMNAMYQPDWFAATAELAARRARASDLEELLRLLPDLREDVAEALGKALTPQLRSTHTATLEAATTRVLDRLREDGEMYDDVRKERQHLTTTSEWLLRSLASVAPARAAAVARSVLATPNDTRRLWSDAAEVLLKTAGDDLAAVTAELLDSADPAVVGAALDSTALRGDEKLQDHAVEAILRNGAQLDRTGVFSHVTDADALRMAKALVADERFVRFRETPACDTLRAIGDSKDPALVGELQRGNRHPSIDVRGCVAEQLGRTFSKEAAPALIEMLRDDSQRVREAAEAALTQISTYLEARERWERLRK